MAEVSILDKDKATTLLNNLKDIDKQVSAGTTSWQNYYSSLKDGERWQINFIENTDIQSAKVNEFMQANKNASEEAETFNRQLKESTFSAKAANFAMSALATVGNMFVSWAIIKVFETAVTAISNYINRVEIANEKTKEAINTFENISSEVESLESKIAELGKQIDDLESIDPITHKEDIENLKLETAELNTQLKILKEKERIAKEEADTAAQASLTITQSSKQNFTKDYRYDSATGGFIETVVGKQVTQGEELKLMMTRYKEVLELKRKTEAELAKMTEAESYSQEEWDKLNDSVKRYESELTGLEKSMNTTALSLSEQAEGLIGTEGKSKELKEETTGLITEYNNLIDSVNGATDALNNNANAQDQEPTEKWSFSETIDQLDTAKEKLSTLDETYAKLFDGDKDTNIGFDDFSAINEAFSDVTDIDNYIQRLQQAGQNTEQVKNVMEDLIGAYLEQSNILDNVTDENKELIATMLQEMGVANAVKLVEDALIATTNARALEESYLVQTGNVLIEQSWEKIESFLNEAKASEVAKQEIALLKLEQMDLQNNPLDLSSNISEILTVAKAAKLAKDELAQLKELEYAQKMAIETKSSFWTDRYYQLADEVKDIGSNIEDVKIDFDPVQYKGGSSTSKAIKDAAKDASDSAKNEFKETIDFFETGIKKLDDSLSLLEASVENVTGAFAKNQLISAQIDLNAQKMNGYASALEMYSQKANEALSGIPEELRDKVVNGAVNLTTFEGEGNEAVVEAINEYNDWADKIAECNQQLAELKETIAQLELEKFNNISEDFSNQFDIRDNTKSLIDKQIKLLEEKDSIDYGGFYKAQIFQTEQQLELLNKEKQALTEQMNESVTSGWVNLCPTV